MKKFNVILMVLFVSFLIMFSCRDKNSNRNISENSSSIVGELEYDSLMAQKYGADDYGMKKYVMAFLKRGPNRSLDSVETMKLQLAHLENITRMAEEGKLVLAGPFFGDGEIRGIYIFNVGSLQEAEALTRTDPAVQAESLTMELKEWYGPAGLMAVNELNKSLARKSITD